MGYKQSREKIASQFALYECIGMDIVPLGLIGMIVHDV